MAAKINVADIERDVDRDGGREHGWEHLPSRQKSLKALPQQDQEPEPGEARNKQIPEMRWP